MVYRLRSYSIGLIPNAKGEHFYGVRMALEPHPEGPDVAVTISGPEISISVGRTTLKVDATTAEDTLKRINGALAMLAPAPSKESK